MCPSFSFTFLSSPAQTRKRNRKRKRKPVAREEERGGDGYVKIAAGASHVRVWRKFASEGLLQNVSNSTHDTILAAIGEDGHENAATVLGGHAARVKRGNEGAGGGSRDGRVLGK